MVVVQSQPRSWGGSVVSAPFLAVPQGQPELEEDLSRGQLVLTLIMEIIY